MAEKDRVHSGSLIQLGSGLVSATGINIYSHRRPHTRACACLEGVSVRVWRVLVCVFRGC